MAKIAGRLLTSGCSFTEHCWSTWADILGNYFEFYKNHGNGGCDNATIARSILKHAKTHDTVVVMWTSFDRWSFYRDKPVETFKFKNVKWQHTGSITRNKTFFTEFYSPVERFLTMLDYINLVDLHSKVNNYKVYHFSAFELFQGEVHESLEESLQPLYQSNVKDLSNNFLREMPLNTFNTLFYDAMTVKHKYTDKDNHPTPLCQWDYVEKHIAPKLNISLTSTHKSDIINEQKNLLENGITIR